jgi:IS30 family transposase
MCHHHEIAQATGMPVFFCHRNNPWQRPSNENTNGLLRDYFPKGTNLDVHTAADLVKVTALTEIQQSRSPKSSS